MSPQIQVSAATLDDKSFQGLTDIILRETGLSITQNKMAMLQSRLAPRLNALGLDSFQEYIRYLISSVGAEERENLISAVTTNVSHFFREPHHFEILTKTLGPEILAKQREKEPVRIWSAGCSNGQEPLSIAMALRESNLILSGGDVRILATDIDTRVLKFAREARYGENLMKSLPVHLRQSYFTQSTTNGEKFWEATPDIKDLISYKPLNLLSNWPMKKGFDAIFCRNVLIYFSPETQDAIWPKFAGALRRNGMLFLGHSERISDKFSVEFNTVSTTTYKLSQSTQHVR